MKKIALKGKRGEGYFALVDDSDYEELNKHKWYLDANGYANSCKFHTPTKMQRLIMGTPKGMDTDHINCNKLDNRRENLRICTRTQNSFNKRKRTVKTSSKYKGVSWFKRDSLWKVQIKFLSRVMHIGYFADEKKAALAYDKKAREYFKEFAQTNF